MDALFPLFFLTSTLLETNSTKLLRLLSLRGGIMTYHSNFGFQLSLSLNHDGTHLELHSTAK